MNYVFGKIKPGGKAARLKTLQNVDDDFELLRGVSRAKGFPDDAAFHMNEAFPNNLQLEDFVANRNGLLVVSAKVRDLVSTAAAPKNELLPVAIINHKGRREKAPYFILNQIGLVDCIDGAKSVCTPNPIDPELFITVDKLVLDERKIPATLSLFRMAKFPMVPVFRRDLADQIVAAKCTGIAMLEVADWKG